jgi:heptosyltransferase I
MRKAYPIARRGSGTLKLIDRYLGIPLVSCLALRPKRSLPAAIAHIGLMKTAAIGDTLLLAGLIDDVRRRYPAARLTLITGTDNASAARLIRCDSDGHVVISTGAPVQSARAIRALGLDVLADFGSWPRFDALLAATSAARYTVGFRTPNQFRHLAFDRAVDHSRQLHERDNYVRLLAALGVEARTEPSVRAPGVLSPARLPATPFVVFHPWSSGYRREVKEWAADRWVALARAFRQRGYSIVVSGGPSERERGAALVAALRAVHDDVHDASGVYSLEELADVLAAATALVSVNTGVAHLGGLLGARTISLEGPTPPVRWRPLGPNVRPVTSSFPNCGFLNLGFEYAGQRLDCMDGVSVDAVLAAFDDLVNASRSPRPRPASPESS